MPTITVETNVRDAAFYRAAAKHWSLWLRGQGVDLNHVITKFTAVADDAVFSGPFPLAGLPPERAGFAFVRCTVARDRTAEFRERLAERIVDAVRGEIRPDRVFISFDLTDPDLHLVGSRLSPTPAEGTRT